MVTRNIQRISFFIGMSVLSVCGVGVFSVHAQEDVVECTMDAKMCPDGSYVGRVGPDCAFAACPGEGMQEPMPVSIPEETDPGQEVVETTDLYVPPVEEEQVSVPQKVLSEETQRNLMLRVQSLTNRMSEIVDVLEDITLRIASRTAKMQDEGIDVTDVSTILSTMPTAMELARENVAMVITNAETMLASEDPNMYMSDVRGAVSAVQVNLTSVYEKLAQALFVLKGMNQSL